MLSAAGRDVLVGGNIGVPLSAQVDESTPETIHVVEASSFQLETTTTFRPWIALWLNFADDHLDRHPTVEAYAAAKARIFANQTADDWAVVNADDPVVMARSARHRRAAGDVLAVGRDRQTAFVVDGDWIVSGARRAGVERLVPVSAVELTGRHMLHNVIAAAAVATHRRRARRRAMVARAARVPRSRARHGAGRRDRRRALRQRLEGDQRRGGAPVDRELRRRRRGDRRRPVQGRRPARAAGAAGRARARRSSRSARPRRWCARRWTTWCRWSRRASMREAVERGYEAAAAGRRRAAGAGVRELRLVPRLRGARTGVQGRGGAVARTARSEGEA